MGVRVEISLKSIVVDNIETSCTVYTVLLGFFDEKSLFSKKKFFRILTFKGSIEIKIDEARRLRYFLDL